MRMLQKHPHKNVISMMQAYHSSEHISILMPNGGRNLYGVLRSGGKPPKELLSFCEQLINGVTHLHKYRIAHRDLKPENILIDYTEESLQLRLCDFGCSQALKDKTWLSDWTGTFPFHAPEMLHPPFAPLPTDVWAVGVVCLETIKGINCITHKARLAPKPHSLQDAKQLTARIACFIGTFPAFCDVSDVVPVNVPEMLTLAVQQRRTFEI
jgi:serine/threonine protein kinase